MTQDKCDLWAKTVRKIYLYHKRALKQNPSHSQLDTSNAFGVAPKVVSMSLSIYPALRAKDEEIVQKQGLRGAYLAILARRKDKKDLLLERLFQ